MDEKEEKLVARLRHMNPSLTVTEMHVNRIDKDKKNKVIDFLHALKLKPSIESCAGPETVVSIDLSSRTRQQELFQQVVSYIGDLGIGDVSISSAPFDECLPEIEGTEDSFQIYHPERFSSEEATAQNDHNTVDQISRGQSDSEIELILRHPGSSSWRESRRLPQQQSSRDVIGSLMRSSERQDQGSTEHLIPSIQKKDKSSSDKVLEGPPPVTQVNQPKPSLWARTKKLFKRKRSQPDQVVQFFHAQVSRETVQREKIKKDVKIKAFLGRKENIKVFPNDKVSLHVLQEQLERVYKDLFKIQNTRLNSEKLSLDAWAQTSSVSIENIPENDRAQSAGKQKEKTKISSRRLAENKPTTSTEAIRSLHSGSSGSNSSRRCRRADTVPRGMITNAIPICYYQPYFLHPYTYNANPLAVHNKGGKFVFRPMTRPKATSRTSNDTMTTNAYSINTSSPATSTSRSSDTTTSNMGSEEDETIIKLRSTSDHEMQNTNCGVATTIVKGPFVAESTCEEDSWSERPFFEFPSLSSSIRTQTVEPDQRSVVTNTTKVLSLPKVTQTRGSKRKRSHPKLWTQSFGTQTTPSASTSCSDLVGGMNSKRTPRGEEGKADKSTCCNINLNIEKGSKEHRCESCNSKLEYSEVDKNHATRRLDQLEKNGIVWGRLPDGSVGFGLRYAPVGFELPNRLAAEKRLCPKIFTLFGGRKRAIRDELKRQQMELLQMKVVLQVINEEIMAESSDSSSDENNPSSEQRRTAHKKVTFSEPLVQ